MKRLVCPKCLRHQDVTENAEAACVCGRDPKSRFATFTVMVPIEQLAPTKENA
jgi:hypothetical protein